jgi:hypothetical protein
MKIKTILFVAAVALVAVFAANRVSPLRRLVYGGE